MAEEHRCQAQKLCANNCGFFGSPATQDLCSKCYRDLHLKEQRSSAEQIINQALSSAAVSSNAALSIASSSEGRELAVVDSKVEQAAVVMAATAAEAPVVQPNRCFTCRKRVGLTGFKCRCERTFCGSHRYAELHGCTFDFKGMGKERIAKANPVVKGEKLGKI